MHNFASRKYKIKASMLNICEKMTKIYTLEIYLNGNKI